MAAKYSIDKSCRGDFSGAYSLLGWSGGAHKITLLIGFPKAAHWFPIADEALCFYYIERREQAYETRVESSILIRDKHVVMFAR